MRKGTYIAGGAGLTLGILALMAANPSLPSTMASALMREGVSGVCNLHIFTAAATTEDLPISAGSSTPAFFVLGEPVKIKVSGGGGSLFMSGDDGPTIGAQGASATASIIYTASSTGAGRGEMFFDGGAETFVPTAAEIKKMDGATITGVCASSVTPFGAKSGARLCRPLCQTNADCSTWGAGATCDANVDVDDWDRKNACIAVFGRFDTDNTSVIYCSKP